MTRTTVHDALLQDHADLEALFVEVQEGATLGIAHRDLCELWRRFDRALLDHLAAEDKHLLPVLEDDHPVEVAALRWEHEEIRTALDELDIAVQLHEIREPAVRAFIERMRAHAAREGDGAYRWAEEALSTPQRRGLLQRMLRAA